MEGITNMTALYMKAPFQTSYVIKTNCDNLIPLLYLQYGKYIVESDTEADFNIKVNKEQSLFEICTEAKSYTTNDPLREIDRILFENTKYDDCVFAMHGAAVEHSGKAYLFLAPTLSGKTTLTSYLSSSGFGYITDDCVLLDRESFNVYPYNTPIHLRSGGLSVLEKNNAAPDALELLDDISMRRYVYTPKNCVTNNLPLGKIFFITRTEKENRQEDMNVTERMNALMKSPITDYTVTREYIKFISELSENDCKRLYYRDLNYVAEVLQNG